MSQSAQTPTEYSFAEAQDHLDEVAEKASQRPVRIVRGGKPPLVLLSGDEYDRLKNPNLMDLIEQWRTAVGPEGLDDGSTWAEVRQG